MEDMEAKMNFSAVVKERFSCKKFDAEKKLSKGLVEKILESGRLAPTAKNLQEQHIYVASSEASLSKIDNVTPCRYGSEEHTSELQSAQVWGAGCSCCGIRQEQCVYISGRRKGFRHRGCVHRCDSSYAFRHGFGREQLLGESL